MAKIVGVRPTVYDFVDKSGRNVHSEGYTFYTVYEQKETDGLACEKVYLANAKIDTIPAVGAEIEIMYNRFGKANGIKVIG